MHGPKSVQPADGFLQLALAAGPVVSRRVMPGDGDVYESLEEVPLGSGCVAPFVLELLVSFEILARPDQLEPAFETHSAIIRIRERC